MKKVYIAVICLSAVLCCVFGILFLKDSFFPVSSATADSAVFSDLTQNVSIAQDETQILELEPDEDALLTGWSSDNNDIVSVDCGGRIDAVKQGEAVVTADFSDRHTRTYRVTVTAPAKEPQVDKYSTAIVANTDIVEKNRKSKSKAPLYRLMVNRSQNCVTAYTYDGSGKYTVPVRAMVCSCGVNDGTITGIFSIYLHTEWHPLVGDVFGQYTSGFSGDYLFHSVPYRDLTHDSLMTDEYNHLGEAASKGCVRMAVADCRWVHDNCAEGTVVAIFDNDNPGPLGKPEAIRIADSECRWDPTDVDIHNPYLAAKPKINGVSDLTVFEGGELNLLKDVTALDSCGNDISGKLEVVGNVNVNRAGTYRVTYKITDALHRSAKATVNVTVEPPEEETTVD